jgi:hypothetical protein
MNQNVHNFIMTVNPNIDIDDKNLFRNLINHIDGDGFKELAFVKEHPEILPMKIKHYTVFDFFYEKVVHDRCHPSHTGKWQDALMTVIQLVNMVEGGETLKDNKKYILRLQGTCQTLTDIFDLLVKEEFDMGDPEFLVYSIISRGELGKLQILSNLYVIEDYPGVLDVALRYGRNSIIRYFQDELELDFPYYGKIMDFENYKDNPRYIYYREHIAHDDTSRNKAIIGASKQDYLDSVQLILKDYQYPVTFNTIKKWCELIKSKEFVWDRINPSEIIPLLVGKLDTALPLTHDFGEFNSLIFGSEWSDRKCLIQHCLNLQKKLGDQEYRCEQIETRYRHLQAKYDTAMVFIEDRERAVGSRIRRHTVETGRNGRIKN